MLVDSTVWVGLLRGEDAPEIALLERALRARRSVWTVTTVLREVLQGADRPERFVRWERAFGGIPLLPEPDPRCTALAAARLYAECRWAGVTPRSSNDCLIARQAIEADVPLLHRDRDFDAIARVDPRLRILRPGG